MQAVSGRRPALAACARLLPGDRVLQRARRAGALELRRARHAECPRRTARGEWRCRPLQRGPVGRGQRELGMRRQPRPRGVRGNVPPLYRVDAELQPHAAALRRRGPQRRRHRLDAPPLQEPLRQLRAAQPLRPLRPLLHLGQPQRLRRRRRTQIQLGRLLRPADPRQHHGARRHRPLGRNH